MVNSGKQLIPCETKISAYTGETPMPPWPLRLTPFPHTSGFLSLRLGERGVPTYLTIGCNPYDLAVERTEILTRTEVRACEIVGTECRPSARTEHL